MPALEMFEQYVMTHPLSFMFFCLVSCVFMGGPVYEYFSGQKKKKEAEK
jgi:hypothetical protein